MLDLESVCIGLTKQIAAAQQRLDDCEKELRQHESAFATLSEKRDGLLAQEKTLREQRRSLKNAAKELIAAISSATAALSHTCE